jgi:hypothetical protein
VLGRTVVRDLAADAQIRWGDLVTA